MVSCHACTSSVATERKGEKREQDVIEDRRRLKEENKSEIWILQQKHRVAMEQVAQSNRQIKGLTRDNKQLRKKVDDSEVAAVFDEKKEELRARLHLRLEFTSRCSSRTTGLLNNKSQTSVNNERRQLFIEQSVLNAIKLGQCKYIRQFNNDGSEKNGIDVMCSSVIVEYSDGTCELIVLTAADLPKDKTALGGFNSIVLTFAYHQEKLRMFTDFCRAAGEDVSKFPKPDDITLEKMADGSVNMSDHCVVALNLKQLVNDLVRGLAEGKYTPEYLATLSAAERKSLCNILDMG